MSKYPREDVEIAISKSMMKEHAIFPSYSGRTADYVDDRNVFGVGTGDGVDGGELTHTEGGDDGRDAFDASIAICCVASIELVDIANPVKASLWNIIQSDEVIVTGHAMH